MKSIVKNIILILGIALCCAVIAFLAVSSNRQVTSSLCKKVAIGIEDTVGLIDIEDIRDIINESLPVQIGKKYKDVELVRVENAIRSQCYVQSAETWITPDGVLHVSVRARKPVCVFRDGDKVFFSDKGGNLFPFREEAEIEVPVIEGKAEQNVGRIDSLINVINNMPADICNLAVDRNGEIEFHRNGTSETFKFGKAADLKEKFEKYRIYLETILPERADSAYSTVDLRYRGQIICK